MYLKNQIVFFLLPFIFCDAIPQHDAGVLVKKPKPKLSTRCAKIQLFYGCRDESADLLRDETDPLNDILTRHTAFSRLEGHPKEYVQVSTTKLFYL